MEISDIEKRKDKIFLDSNVDHLKKVM